MSESRIPSHSSSEKVELSIHIDSELLDQIKHLTNDPSKVIETAIKQWLRGERREDDQAMSLRRNPPVPPRGEWNDWDSVLSRPIQRVQICWVWNFRVWNFARANSGGDLEQILRWNTGCSEQSEPNSQPGKSSLVTAKMRQPVPDLSYPHPKILVGFSNSIVNQCRLLIPKS